MSIHDFAAAIPTATVSTVYRDTVEVDNRDISAWREREGAPRIYVTNPASRIIIDVKFGAVEVHTDAETEVTARAYPQDGEREAFVCIEVDDRARIFLTPEQAEALADYLAAHTQTLREEVRA